MSNYHLLGQNAAQVAFPDTYSPDAMKDISAFTKVVTPKKYRDSYYWDKYGAGQPGYELYPFLWKLPRNHLESAGTTEIDLGHDDDGRVTYGVKWTGRAFRFKDPQKYINGLKVIDTPIEYIRYLKLAPLAGFDTTGIAGWEPALPGEALYAWWREVISYHILKMSFLNLDIAQIQDLPDLALSYENAGKLIDKIRAEMRSEEPVDVLPVTGGVSKSTGFRVYLKLQDGQINALEKGLQKILDIYASTKQKMAARVIELSDPNAKIADTAFSVDPLSNPYLVYNQEKSIAERAPVFENVARNAPRDAGLWKPADVVGNPATMQYWQQVPAYEAAHERIYATEAGPMSESDIAKYGLDGSKRTNWLPWIVAGGAAAYAASQLL